MPGEKRTLEDLLKGLGRVSDKTDAAFDSVAGEAAASSGFAEEKKETEPKNSQEENTDEEKIILGNLYTEIGKMSKEFQEQERIGKITGIESYNKNRVLGWPYESTDIEDAKEMINKAFLEKNGINESEARRLFSILEIPEDEINKIIASKEKENLPEEEEEKKEGESPMEEKFKEIEQRHGQRVKEKDTLLQKAEEFNIAAERYNRIKNIYKTEIEPIYNGEKNHLISLFRNAEKAIRDIDLEEFNNLFALIENGINEVIRNIEEEKQVKKADKEIRVEAEKLPEEERKGYFKKIADLGYKLKLQKARGMKYIFNSAAEGFLAGTKEGREAKKFRGKQERDSERLSDWIRELKAERNEILKELKEEGKTEEEINVRLKELNIRIDEAIKNEIEAIRNEEYREKEIKAKEKEAHVIYRFLNAYSEKIYEKEEKNTRKRIERGKMYGYGVWQKTGGMGQLFGNLWRAGRISYDALQNLGVVGASIKVLNPAQSLTALILFFGRFAEAGKETRLSNVKIKSGTRIGGEEAIKNKDAKGLLVDAEYLRAYEEALRIYGEAKKNGKLDEKTGKINISEDDLERAYSKFENFDILVRLGAYNEIVDEYKRESKMELVLEEDEEKKKKINSRLSTLSRLPSVKTEQDFLELKIGNSISEEEKSLLIQALKKQDNFAVNTRSFAQRAAAYTILKQSKTLHKRLVNISLNKKLTAEQKKLKKEFYFKTFESYLKDVDRMVDQAGNVDLLSYGMRLGEKTAKAFSLYSILFTGWNVLWKAEGFTAGAIKGMRGKGISTSERSHAETGGWKERIKERVIGKGKEEEEAPTPAPRGQKWRDYIPGLGVEEKKEETPEAPSETRPQTSPKAPSAPERKPEEPSLEIPQEEAPEGTQSPEIDELDKEILGKQEEIQENNNFLARVISPSSAEAAEQFKTFKESFNFLKGEEKENFKKIYLELKKSNIAEKVNKDAGGGERGKEAILAEVFKRMKERGLLGKETQSVLPFSKIPEIKGEIWTRERAVIYLNKQIEGWELNKDKNEDAAKLFLMFSNPNNKKIYLKILTGEGAYNGKTGFQAADNWMTDNKVGVRVPEAAEPSAPEEGIVIEEEPKAETPAEKRERLKREGRLEDLAGKPEEKAAPRPQREAPPAPERRRAETPRPSGRPEILDSNKHTAVIQKGGSLWNAMAAMNLKTDTFNKAWADAKIYVGGQETDYKAHEVGLIDPKTKVIYNEKTNTINIIPPEGGTVGDNDSLNERFEQKGVKTPDWLKRELGMGTEEEPLLPKRKELPSLPEREKEEELLESGKEPEKSEAEIISKLEKETGFSKEDINSISKALKAEPKLLSDTKFLDVVGSDKEVFKEKGAWDTEKLEFFYSHKEIPLKDTKVIFEYTEIVNSNLGLKLSPENFYSRFAGPDNEIKISDSEGDAVKIETPENAYYIDRSGRAEIRQKLYKSLFAEDEYISARINPKEISAKSLNSILNEIKDKQLREYGLARSFEDDLNIKRDNKGEIIGEENQKLHKDWFRKTVMKTDLKVILEDDWPKRFRSGLGIFKSKEETAAEKLRDIFIYYFKKSGIVSLEKGDEDRTAGEILAKYINNLTKPKE